MRHSPRGSARSGRRQATLTVSVRTARRSNGSSLPLNDNRARTSDVNPIIFSWHMAFGVQVSDPRWELAGRLVPERQGRIGFQLIYDWRFSLFSCRVAAARATSVRIGFTSTMRRGGSASERSLSCCGIGKWNPSPRQCATLY